jgi:hypothetical protein
MNTNDWRITSKFSDDFIKRSEKNELENQILKTVLCDGNPYTLIEKLVESLNEARTELKNIKLYGVRPIRFSSSESHKLKN